MKKRTKITALLMAMVLVMGSMTACGSDDSEEKDTSNTANNDTNTEAEATPDASQEEAKSLKLTVWAPQEDHNDYSSVDEKYKNKHGLIGYMCDQFNEAHPNWDIEFDYKVCGEDQAYNELSKDPEAGGDVFMYAGDQSVALVENGIMNQLVIGEDVTSNNPADAMNAVTVDDGVYGVPFTPNTWFMYYDKSKLTEEDVQSLDAIMAKDTGCEYNFCMDLTNGWYNGGFFYAAGCSVFGEDGTKLDECNFNDENGLAAAKVMLGLAKNKKFLCNDANNVGLSKLKEGQLAAYCGGSWNAADVKAALKDNYAATTLPKININGEEKQLNSIGSYKYIGVNANTADPEVAQKLAIWLGGEECQRDRFIARGVTPTWTSLTESDEVKSDVCSAALTAQSAFIAMTPQNQKFSTNYWGAMEGLGKGMMNGEVTEKNLQKQLDLLSENIVTELAE